MVHRDFGDPNTTHFRQGPHAESKIERSCEFTIASPFKSAAGNAGFTAPQFETQSRTGITPATLKKGSPINDS
jgi:hypothetical protein